MKRLSPNLFTISALLGLWILLKPVVFPFPWEVLGTFPSLLSEGMLDELLKSLFTNLEAGAIAALIGLPLCYFSRHEWVQPLATFVSKLRFLSPAVFFLPLVFLTGGGHDVKVGLLVLGQLFYLVTTMTGVVLGIPQYRFDDADVLRKSSLWYVIVRGTVPEAITAVRDNAAIGWSMLMFVEGLVRSEGGIGVMILNMEKHVEWSSLFALISIVFVVGILQDWTIGQIKKVVCPYA